MIANSLLVEGESSELITYPQVSFCEEDHASLFGGFPGACAC